MDHYSDSTNGFPSINIKSTAGEGGRVTSCAKMNQLLPQLKYTATVLSEERTVNTREGCVRGILLPIKCGVHFYTMCLVYDCKKEKYTEGKSMTEHVSDYCRVGPETSHSR